jgi:hypothetical protein
VVSVLVIVWGGIHNHNIKYTPVDVATINDSDITTYSNCSKGFVNVFATSIDEPGALVCCSKYSTSYPGSTEAGICSQPHWIFFVSRRLARFPEAWMLPLFPLFIRLIVHMLQKANFSTTAAASSTTQQRLARRRFYLYVFLIQFRGWILYLLFDKIEEYFAAPAESGCWYESLLHENYHSCEGQVSDFSDHVVLYFAQILPIAFVEVLHSFVEPFWKSRISSNNPSHQSSSGTHVNRLHGQIPTMVPALLLTSILYLYVVTLMGAYKTSVYFHTWPEILNGYLISLLVQVPLCFMQCTSLLGDAREYFFGYTI